MSVASGPPQETYFVRVSSQGLVSGDVVLSGSSVGRSGWIFGGA